MAKSNVPPDSVNVFAILERVDRETDLLSDAEIYARLSGKKPIKIQRKTFLQRITAADRFHARALGVKL